MNRSFKKTEFENFMMRTNELTAKKFRIQFSRKTTLKTYFLPGNQCLYKTSSLIFEWRALRQALSCIPTNS